MIPFKPYKSLPSYGSSWNGPYVASQAMAFILPRGATWAVKLPPDSKRFQIFSFEKAYRIKDENGRSEVSKKYNKVLMSLASRLPMDTVIEVFANDKDVIVSDILLYRDQDVRPLKFQQRMATWWYMPQEFRSMVFFNGTDFSRLDDESFYSDISKVLFKPDFVGYPKLSHVKVYNWLQMRAPDVDESQGDASKPDVRSIGPGFTPRGSKR